MLCRKAGVVYAHEHKTDLYSTFCHVHLSSVTQSYPFNDDKTSLTARKIICLPLTTVHMLVCMHVKGQTEFH